jgi:tetratricopeptide (TPR) repeat protein
LDDVNLALSLAPELNWAKIGRGLVYLKMRYYDLAIEELNRISADSHNYAEVVANRGYAYLMRHQYQDALSDFNTALQLDSDDDWTLFHRALALQLLEQTEYSQYDFDRAIEIAQQKYVKLPDNVGNTFNLALYCLVTGNTDHANQLYTSIRSSAVDTQAIQEAIHDIEGVMMLFPDSQKMKEAKNLVAGQSGNYLIKNKR